MVSTPIQAGSVALARAMTKALEEAPAEVAGAVNEHVAAARLGVSLDVLRKDRRSGRLGIPYIKIGEGKRGLVRYDLADLDRWVETKKRVGQATRRPAPLGPAPIMQPRAAPQPVEPAQPWTAPEPPEPMRMPRQYRSPWDVMVPADPPADEDPFATGRPQRRSPGGYFSGGF